MILAALQKDLQFYHQLRFPGRKPTLFFLTRVALGSRGLLVIAIHRLSYSLACGAAGGGGRLLKTAVRLALLFGGYLRDVLTKSETLSTSLLEPGLYLSNKGHLTIGARRIGSGTLIHERVTIGMNFFEGTVPEIGRNVWIGPDSVIYGRIEVGDGVTVMPNTVLSRSVPDRVVVKGNPAVIVRRDFDNSVLRCSLETEIQQLLPDEEFA
jgi:serine acetyltransferase